MRAIIIGLAVLAITTTLFFGGFHLGMRAAFEKLPPKCPAGQRMVHQSDGIDACFTPGVYYSDIRI